MKNMYNFVIGKIIEFVYPELVVQDKTGEMISMNLSKINEEDCKMLIKDSLVIASCVDEFVGKFVVIAS